MIPAAVGLAALIAIGTRLINKSEKTLAVALVLLATSADAGWFKPPRVGVFVPASWTDTARAVLDDVDRCGSGLRARLTQKNENVTVVIADFGKLGTAGDDGDAGTFSEFEVKGKHFCRAYINTFWLTPGIERHRLCHELGHCLGLYHQDDATSCMRSGSTALTYNDHDCATLRVLYPR